MAANNLGDLYYRTQKIEIKERLRILGLTVDNKLSFKDLYKISSKKNSFLDRKKICLSFTS